MHIRRKRGVIKSDGFTTIEIAFVILLIGVLLGIILVTHAGVAEQERNTDRRRDIDELHVELEAYYGQDNKYPTLAQINNSTWRTDYMKGVRQTVFQDPSGKSHLLAAKPTKDVYAYQPTSQTGSACNNTTIPCTQYTLTATLEGGGTYVDNNLN